MPTREPKGKLITISTDIQNLARQRNLHSHEISRTIYEKNDPWRSMSIRNLSAKGGDGISVIQPTTAFARSYIGMTVRSVITPVASASTENLSGPYTAMMYVLKAITVSENATVVTVEKVLERSPAKKTTCSAEQSMWSHRR